MTWLAVVFFCTAEADCYFWFKETLRPIECEKAVSEAVKAMNHPEIPVVYGTCRAIKGSPT